jgi:hypothetical protein
MRGDLYDKDRRFIGREGGLSNADPLGRAIAASNAGQAGGGGTFNEAGAAVDAQGKPLAPAAPADNTGYLSDAGDQLKALQGQQQQNWAAQGFNDQAFAQRGPSGGGFRGWMGHPPPDMNMQSLAATNPNVLNNQNSAANQFAALDAAGVQGRDRVTVQGVNGSNDYIRGTDGKVVPSPTSLDAISATNAKMPGVNVGWGSGVHG